MLDESVKNEAFQVCSIFCVLQSAQLVNTFCAYNASGEELTSGQWSTGFMKCLAHWFAFDEKSQMTVTPYNPFVLGLGYGIYQKLPPAPGGAIVSPASFPIHDVGRCSRPNAEVSAKLRDAHQR